MREYIQFQDALNRMFSFSVFYKEYMYFSYVRIVNISGVDGQMLFFCVGSNPSPCPNDCSIHTMVHSRQWLSKLLHKKRRKTSNQMSRTFISSCLFPMRECPQVAGYSLVIKDFIILVIFKNDVFYNYNNIFQLLAPPRQSNVTISLLQPF